MSFPLNDIIDELGLSSVVDAHIHNLKSEKKETFTWTYVDSEIIAQAMRLTSYLDWWLSAEANVIC